MDTNPPAPQSDGQPAQAVPVTAPVGKVSSRLRKGLKSLLRSVYPDHDDDLADRVIEAFWPEGSAPRSRSRTVLSQMWSEQDCYVICYGNSLIDGEPQPLDLLTGFLETDFKGAVRRVDTLPSFPFTSH